MLDLLEDKSFQERCRDLKLWRKEGVPVGDRQNEVLHPAAVGHCCLAINNVRTTSDAQ